MDAVVQTDVVVSEGVLQRLRQNGVSGVFVDRSGLMTDITASMEMPHAFGKLFSTHVGSGAVICCAEVKA